MEPGRRSLTTVKRAGRRVLALVLLVTLLAAACSSDDGPAPHRAVDAPVRSTTTTAPPPPVLERLAVDPVVFGGAGDQRAVAVSSGVAPAIGSRLVAIGSSEGRPAVWWSADGRTWRRATLPAEQFAEGTRLHDVAADPVAGGWSAVGADGDRAAAWMSSDGERWVRAEVDDGPPMTRVTPTGLGLVALGTAGDRAAAWQSFSGERWLRAVDDPGVFARPGAPRVVDVVDAGAEVQALVEREGGGTEVWRSADAVVWSVATPPASRLLPAAGASRAVAATTLGEVVVVVGADSKDDGVDASMWLSNASASFEQVAHDEEALGGDGDQSMAAAVQAGDRLLVVGSETDETGDVDAVVWASSPGGGLVRIAAEGPAVPGDQHVSDVAMLGQIPVAVGWEQTGAGVDAVAWTVGTAPLDEAEAGGARGPSLGWRRVTGQDSLGGPGEQRLEAVAAGTGGWVAVGAAGSDDGEADGAAWRSADGVDWARVTGQESLGGPGDQRLLDVAAGPSGFVAVGLDGESAAVWTSPDGGAWERVPHDEAVFGGPGDQRAEAVAVLAGDEGGWVAVGGDAGAGGGDAAVWRSPDAMGWERVPDDGGLGGPGLQAALDVVAGPGGPTAVGVGDGSAAAWTSSDGRSWVGVALGGGGAASGVAVASGSGLVAVGATGGDGSDAVVWRSPDGGAWERQEGEELAGPLDQALEAVAVSEAMAVVVGRTNLGGGDDAAAWSSTDGAAWARSAHDEELFGGDQAQRMVDVAVRGGRAVAVGWSGSAPGARDAAVWVSELRGGGARGNL